MRAADCDLLVVGAGFAGLVAAATAASRGLRVVVLEAKSSPGARVHTTGLLVKEAAEELDFPLGLTRRIHSVRLYAPNLKHIELAAPGYYFLATDTGPLLDWMAARAEANGARLLTKARFGGARIEDGIVHVEPAGISARFVLGADGARSAVAKAFGLARNRHFLAGIEAELTDAARVSDHLHCFLDSVLAPGYLGWVVPGVGVCQAGLAVRQGVKPNLRALFEKTSPLFGLDIAAARDFRAGLIPCGGLVRPFASRHALLVGDAAGLVSPLTAGGIQRALHLGRKASLAICDYFLDGGIHPGAAMDNVYPRFAAKRLLRLAANAAPPNAAYDFLMTTPLFRALAREIFFRSRSVKTHEEFGGALGTTSATH